jgi:HNH endonuclease
MPRFYMNTIDRFLAKAAPIPIAGCWIWIGCSHPTGYGRFSLSRQNVEFAHRAAWILFVGPIPAGMDVCHHCDVRMCVNPYHLFTGTRGDNMRDASRKGRIAIPERNYHSSETHQVAKLSNDQVRHIRESKLGSSELGRLIGVSRQTIYRARRGLSFRDVS